MKALIIRSPWINLILAGIKSWEIRGSNTLIRGEIALIKSGSGHIYGTAKLIESFPISIIDLAQNKIKHCIDDINIVNYAKPHAWVLTDIKIHYEPIKYIHPQGAVIWVNV